MINSLHITYETFEIPAAEAGAGASKEFLIEPETGVSLGSWKTVTTVRVLGIRVYAGALPGATSRTQRVLISHKSGTPPVWVDIWSAVASTADGSLQFTGGSWNPDSVVFRGSLDNAVGSAECPLYLLYFNPTDVNHTEDVRIDLVLAHE